MVACIGRRSLKQQGTSAFQVLLACLGTQGEAVWLFRFCPGCQPPVFAQFDLWSTFNLINKSQVGVSVVCGSVWAGWWNPPTLKLGPMSSRDLLPLILSFLQGKRGAQSWVSLPVHGRWPRLALVWHQSGQLSAFQHSLQLPPSPETYVRVWAKLGTCSRGNLGASYWSLGLEYRWNISISFPGKELIPRINHELFIGMWWKMTLLFCDTCLEFLFPS